MNCALIVFARYPQPGQCKTRLIPALGEQGACELHTQMTRHTLDWTRQLAEQLPARLQVRYLGGSEAAMREQFGLEGEVVPQAEGDLGAKLRHAVERMFGDSNPHILAAGGDSNGPGRDIDTICLIGTDCPELSAETCRRAIDRLRTHDVCLIPAVDGGYVLLGLRRPAVDRLANVFNALFENIPWGKAGVLRQTVEQLISNRASVALLEPHRDVDLPEDVEAGRDALRRGRADVHRPRVSLIIPVYSTEPGLKAAIESAKQTDVAIEIIVVAAGDTAAATRTVVEHGVQLLYSAPNRAVQMNAGAAIARGELLLFLHADSRLPPNYAERMVRGMERRPSAAYGAFALSIDGASRRLRWVEWAVDKRTRRLKLPYGDQALFCTREQFASLGGYPPLPIMEDYALVRRLRRTGRMLYLPEPVTTSARRWQRLGIVRTTLANQAMLLGYHLGIPVKRLARFYRSR